MVTLDAAFDLLAHCLGSTRARSIVDRSTMRAIRDNEPLTLVHTHSLGPLSIVYCIATTVLRVAVTVVGDAAADPDPARFVFGTWYCAERVRCMSALTTTVPSPIALSVHRRAAGRQPSPLRGRLYQRRDPRGAARRQLLHRRPWYTGARINADGRAGAGGWASAHVPG